MAEESPATPEAKHKRRRSAKPELRVIFDTNALYVTPTSIGSASDLVRQEIVELIAAAKYPDLEILWYLPEIVRHERQYQMQAEALKLRSAINKIERLLSHNLALTDQALLDHVAKKIDDKEKELGLRELKVDHVKVDWAAVTHAASYRLPPFAPGEKEKGFRDAIVAEAFMQLVSESPKTAKVCRVILITSDELLTHAVRERISGLANAAVLSNIEELKGLINTLVSNVNEEFIATLKPKAAKLFFTSSADKDALYYKEKIRERITEKFERELSGRPEGTAYRKNGRWLLSQPNFARKEGKRIFWTSRITIEVEAGNLVSEPPSFASALSLLQSSYAPAKPAAGQQPSLLELFKTPASSLPTTAWSADPYTTYLSSLGEPPEKRVATHKGTDTYEILWSAEVTLAKELKRTDIEDIIHVELDCQPIS